MSNGPIIILVEPQLGENIGMTARAMANFGLHDMRLVNPRENWLNQKTYAAAAGADFILDGVTLYDTVKDAVADLHFVYATTARERGQGKPVHGPSDAAINLKTRASTGEKTGVLFGRERTGLENLDIALADAICTYPIEPSFSSLNLSQAVLLMGYAYRTAVAEPQLPFGQKNRWPPAERAAVLNFFDFLEEKLEERGFFRPASKKDRMSLNLRNILLRIGMDEQDLRTLRGMVVRLVEGPRVPYSKQQKREAAEKAANVSDQDNEK
jgi:tRNA/rRNA methyltransferase